MHGGRLASPIEADERIALVTELLGVSAADIRRALDALRGSLVLLVDETDGPQWSFKHPTIGDAYATLVAESPELTEIYLHGAKFERLLEEVVCGNIDIEGAAVRVGPSLYQKLINRLLVKPLDFRTRYFLGERCDDAFLRLIVEHVPSLLDLRPRPFMAYSSENRVLARLHKAQLLPEEKRHALADYIADTTVEVQDGAVFRDSSLRSILTDDELASVVGRVKSEVLSKIRTHVSDWKSNCTDDDPDSHFEELTSFLNNVEDHLSVGDEHWEKIEDGRRAISKAIDDLNEARAPDIDHRVETPVGRIADDKTGIESIFEDVDR
jgi:hypothetical protein